MAKIHFCFPIIKIKINASIECMGFFLADLKMYRFLSGRGGRAAGRVD